MGRGRVQARALKAARPKVFDQEPRARRAAPSGLTGKRYQRWLQTCGRKAAFPYEDGARRRAEDTGMEAYRCKYGDHWHLARGRP